ncbi:cuticle protein 10.9-like [Varroa jacobsoni]|uniref:Cuticle protein 10.9-like n=1 Tax=Varroa destructor TaxID=109461 RepID=A0A7M7K463_VARDE|nr:adult-specific rigid cuticular protein 15.5-like [Varroa destructor]XP_022709722.1 cuticle protein 10.9-like [Varroa jacobsoni]
MKSFIVLAAFVAVAAGQGLGQEKYEPPAPYQFAYASEDKEGSSSHEESTDGSGRIQGKYTMQLADGRARTVTYWADNTGFHADIITNELGTESKNPADVTIQSSAPTGPEAALAAEGSRVKARASYIAPTIVPAPAATAFAALAPIHNRFFRA